MSHFAVGNGFFELGAIGSIKIVNLNYSQYKKSCGLLLLNEGDQQLTENQSTHRITRGVLQQMGL